MSRGSKTGIDEGMLGGGNEQKNFMGHLNGRDQSMQKYGNFEGFPLY